MAKENKTFRLSPKVIFEGKQAAEFHGRTMTNLIEYLLTQEIKRLKKEGVPIENYMAPVGVVAVGKAGAADPELKKMHNELLGG